MVADSAFVRATGSVVLHPGAVENPYLIVIHTHRHPGLEFPPRAFQHLPHPFVQAKPGGGLIEKEVNLIKDDQF